MNFNEAVSELRTYINVEPVIALISEPGAGHVDALKIVLEENAKTFKYISTSEFKLDSLLREINGATKRGVKTIIIGEPNQLYSDYDLILYSKLISIAQKGDFQLVFTMLDEMTLRELTLYDMEEDFWLWFKELPIPKINLNRSPE